MAIDQTLIAFDTKSKGSCRKPASNLKANTMKSIAFDTKSMEITENR